MACLLLAGCGRDFSLPQATAEEPITGLEVTPNPAAANTEIEISFRLRLPSRSDPEVGLLGKFATLISGPDSSGHFRYLYVSTGNEPEGQEIAVDVSAPLDRGRTQASTSMVFDFTPPTLVSAAVTPTLAIPGDTLTLDLVFDEATRLPRAALRGEALSCELLSGAHSICRLVLDGSQRPGPVQLSLEAEDLAGNPLQAELGELGSLRAGDRATISALQVNPDPAAAGTELEITFDSDRTLDPSTLVSVDGVPATQLEVLDLGDTLHYRYSYLVTGNESEGAVAVLVDAVDGTDPGAPHTQLASSVLLDFTAPSIVSVTAAPALVGVGDSVTLELEADEALAGIGVTLGFPQLSLKPVCGMEGDAKHWSCRYHATGLEIDGPSSALIVPMDLAGNLGPDQRTDLFEFDLHCNYPGGALWLVEQAGVNSLLVGEPGAMEAGSMVEVSAPGNQQLLASGTAASDGSFSLDLGAAVSAAEVGGSDALGNPCATVQPRHRLRASFVGKQSGSSSNPSVMRSLNLAELLIPLAEARNGVEFSTADYALVAGEDAAIHSLSSALQAAGTAPLWYDKNSLSTLAPRADHAMAYDASLHKVVTFGGYGGTDTFGSVEAWDGRSWITTTSVQAGIPQPRPRCYAHLEPEPGRTSLLLVDGDNCSVGPGLASDFWRLENGQWTSITRRGIASEPPSTSGAVMAPRGPGGNLVVVGGGTSGTLLDTFRWDGQSWARVYDWKSSIPNPSPACDGVAAAEMGSSLIRFGGKDGCFSLQFFNETWRWDSLTWTQLLPTISPPASASGGLILDLEREVDVHVTGFTGLTGFVPEVWEWDGQSWKNTTPTNDTLPDGLGDFGLAYDAYRGRTVLFGGWRAGGTTNLLTEYGYPYKLPAAYAALSFPAGAASAGQSLQVHAVASGLGASEQTGDLAGVKLFAWNLQQSAWIEVASHQALASDSAASKQLDWSLAPADFGAYLAGGSTLHLLLRAQHGATDKGPATLTIDSLYAELDQA